MRGLSNRLYEEADALSGQGFDCGCAPAGVLSNLLTEAATALDSLTARVKELEAKNEKLNLHLQHFVESVQYSDSYGVPGSDFAACLCCRGGGAPGVPLVHESHCPVGRSLDSYQDWCDEQREFEQESRENAARALRAEQQRDEAARDAERYRFLRGRDLDTIHIGGVFAGMTPQNIVLNEDDLDREVDAAIRSDPKETTNG